MVILNEEFEVKARYFEYMTSKQLIDALGYLPQELRE
jgi:hypothetical protein